MTTNLENLKQRFASLSSRERNIILVLALVLVAFLFDLLLISPIMDANKKTRQQINSLALQMNEQNRKINALTGSAGQDQHLGLKREVEDLQRALQILDNKINLMSAGMIPPRQMTEVLEQVLRENTRLTLVNVNTLPSEKLTTGGRSDSNTSAGGTLFRHTVELELQGDYFDTLKYLQAVEALPWKVLWRELDYRVENYPKASIKLRLNTLSKHASWIGA